jgi:hypothetical protein
MINSIILKDLIIYTSQLHIRLSMILTIGVITIIVTPPAKREL